ncbi:MAG: hypothetical protein ACQESC_00245 [Nanobdellota archaeon]
MVSSKTNKHSKRRVSSSQKALPVLTLVFGLLAILMIISTSFILLQRQNTATLSESNVSYDFTVGDDVGFILDTDAMHYGVAPAGSSSQRGLFVNSSEDGVVYLSSQGDGNISFSKNAFPISAGDQEIVSTTLQVPSSLSPGNYSGSITVTVRRGGVQVE